MSYPTEYHYSKEHEWIKLDGNTVTLGITDYAQGELGEIVFVELPEVGAGIKIGEPMGSVESVKAVSDIFSPVSGKVTEANAALEDAPETVNSDPHGEGWMAKVELFDPAELEGLMDAAAYEKFITEGK